jgi:putative solute:sodium symporter small subunit
MSQTNSNAANDAAWWQKTWTLMVIAMVIWAFFSFVIHMFVKQLNEIVIFGFPLGFYMAAQGSLIAFVVLLFWFAHRQDSIDREFGIAEDE